MKRVIIIHGTRGAPDENWHPWLADLVRKTGNEVDVPPMPTPEGQELDNWFDTIRQTEGQLTSNDILVGHSVGATFALRLIERAHASLFATFLVSCFTEPLDDPKYDDLVASFIKEPFDWGTIQENAGKMYMYHGDDDPAVPLSQAQEISKKLSAPLRIIPKGGHLSESAGITELPELWKDLKPLLN